MFEDSKTPAVAWENTTTLPKITVDPEKMAAAAETLRKAWAGIMASFEVAAEAFGKWIRSVAAEVEAQHEMETALRWARCCNRPLYNRAGYSPGGLHQGTEDPGLLAGVGHG